MPPLPHEPAGFYNDRSATVDIPLDSNKASQHREPPAPGPVEQSQRRRQPPSPPGEGRDGGAQRAAAGGVHEERQREVQLRPEESVAGAATSVLRGVPGVVPCG